MRLVPIALLLCSMLAFACQGHAQPLNPYDEWNLSSYKLPDPLVLAEGQRVSDAAGWQKRRPEILRLFEENVYGKTPAAKVPVAYEVRSVTRDALGGKAVRKLIRIRLGDRPDGPKIDVLAYLPAGGKPVPVFLGLNFSGNHTVYDDPEIPITDAWTFQRPQSGAVQNRATEKTRGTQKNQWQVDLLLARGYGLVTACYGDIEPDHKDGYAASVRTLLARPGQKGPEPGQWGAIGAWAWGLSRILDYLETDKDVDSRRVAVMGHSRLGKTALWAGAQDPRFALVISNNSGCGGAAIERRPVGETIAHITAAFPHWFTDKYRTYRDRVNELPVDQHMLIALIAPRPVYVASAEEDHWADPRGEFLACLGADPVYRLLGTSGLSVKEMPGVEKPALDGTIGYHIRRGKHDVTAYDWRCYLDFADRHLKSRE